MNTKSLFQPQKENEVVNFIHIPKTAGISFNNLIVNLFNEDEVYVSGVFQLYQKMHRGGKFDVAPFKYFRAHLGYIPDFFNRPLRNITMLRDPVKQVVSSFKQLVRAKGEPGHYIWEYYKDFKPIFTSELYGTGYWNLQTRFVSGYFEIGRNPYINYQGTQPFNDPLFLEIAKQNLDNFAFFGVTNQFANAIELLEYIFGWKLAPPDKKNATPDEVDYEFTTEDIDLIKSYNQLDIQLVEYAQQKFEEAYKKMQQEKEENPQERPIVLETRDSAESEDQSKFKKRCSLCKKRAVFSASTLQCSKCQSTPSSRAVKKFLDKNFRNWEKDQHILEYNPYLWRSLGQKANIVAAYDLSDIEPTKDTQGITSKNPAKLNYQNQSFDIVICLDTIDTVIAPEKVIEEMLRVLKFGGTLIISIPTKEFINDDRAKRWRASEIEGRYQPLYPVKYRKSAINTDMLIALEFSKNIEEIFGRWAMQPVDIIDIRENPTKTSSTKLIVISKKYDVNAGKFEREKITSLEQMLERGNYPTPVRLDIDHEIVLLQQKAISSLQSEIARLKIQLKDNN